MKYKNKFKDQFPENTILFDGVCNFCNLWVNFVIKFDKNKKFKFAFLQNEKSKQFINYSGLNNVDTIILFKKNFIYTKSDAALEVMSTMHYIFFFTKIFFIIPRFIRNFVYDFIGRNRYKFFGKKNECRIPSKDEMERFII